uniref:lysylphosphatidylglycerol synthase transmembrane domain-containing protein n=1 Tax=Prevotella sp. TaxID=59823 RepID=UPI004026F4D3
MEIKKLINNSLKVGLSIMLGGLILYWMYRDFDFKTVADTLMHGMNWTWMLLSFPFGILAQMFRGWRWHLTLEPIGEKPRTSTSINSIFLSYAVSLIVKNRALIHRSAAARRERGGGGGGG